MKPNKERKKKRKKATVVATILYAHTTQNHQTTKAYTLFFSLYDIFTVLRR